MLNNADDLISQKYGAVICKKKYREEPDLIDFVLVNPRLKKFGDEIIELS